MVKIKVIDNPNVKYMGLAMNKNIIRINMANIGSDDEYRATLVHEVAHCLLHFCGKRYSYHEKEYQASIIEYNYCRNHSNSCVHDAIIRLKHHKKALKGQNININHLRYEAKASYGKAIKEVKKHGIR